MDVAALPLNTTRWYLLRHAQPLIEAGICYGHVDMPADTEDTKTAAAEFVKFFCGPLDRSVPLPAHPVLLQCSPLMRCQQLAKAIWPLLQMHGLEPDAQTVQDLAELNFGAWDGVSWDSIAPGQWQKWDANFAHYRPGGAESVAELVQRVRHAAQATAQWLQQHPHGTALWVTHAGVMQALHWLLHHGLALPASPAEWPHDGACTCGNWRALGDAAISALAAV